MKICYSINKFSYNEGLISLNKKFVISRVDYISFRLKEVLVIFQQLITKVLRPYLFEFIMVYLDDIIIFFQIMDEYF